MTPSLEATGPLSGITVVDLTRVLSGPYCTMMLADMGARVIKIERPGSGDDTRAWGPPFVDGESAYFLSVNRNKESVTLDFKKPEGLALLKRLVDQADVVVENFRPGTLARLGLDYETLAPDHARLIYCSVSGFGQTGPRRSEPGYDAVIQAEGGLMSLTGSDDGPPFRTGIAIADVVSGMLSAHGIVLALHARQQTGRGQRVDVAMLDAIVSLMTYQAGIYFATGLPPGRLGNRHPTIVPYETFAVADGDFMVAAGNDELFRRFCAALDLGPLADDERFNTNAGRVSRYEELRPLLAARLETGTRAHWVARLSDAGVPCGAIRDLREVFSDPQLRAREMIAQVEHQTIGAMNVVGIPIQLSGTPGQVRTAPPLLGQHTEAVLRDDLRLGPPEVARLRSLGAI
jgi:crotonobetainyl-CoA:carnitine CoA-transferase CaiB-like acyl-CoA transferase